ncbi:MAG TPA: hypothetical protein VGQ22_04650 [Steroidobacteraceae bacterium]|nr:hypothetical protein [Steroidobacteraceae bacterium]
MRAALAIALMMAATSGWAAEPAAPDENKQATAEPEVKRPFKPPGGWRPKRVNGELVYCTKVREYNSRISREECRTEAQLRDLIRANRAAREELEKQSKSCSGTGCMN